MRDIPVGNGSLLVTFDDKYQVRDIYFPHVGQENHTEGFPFRFGVWADGQFSWVFHDGWKRKLKYLPETLVTDVRLINDALGVEIVCNDTVASHENVFLRKVRVSNLLDKRREIRVFLHHDFRISENKIGDTAFYDPESSALIHYKKNRYFLVNSSPPFDHFATGRKAFRDQEGTWRDAEDGELNGAPITEGSVDSTIQFSLALEPQATGEFYYWIAVGESREIVRELNANVLSQTPRELLDYTEHFWRAWVNKNDVDFDGLSPEIIDLYKRSLLIMRTQIDNCGSILAANDSDVAERATDHYSYLWTRDGAFVAHALDLAGYPSLTRNFFAFCANIVHEDGYFLQKYNADGTVASGWHASWDAWARRKLIPIQEDETALVLWALWEHYDRYREIDFAHHLYHKLIVKCADFLVSFRDPETGLPRPSWNLWEDRRGIHTFTCATVVAGLRAAANFSRLFSETRRAASYDDAAEEVVAAMRTHLFSHEIGRFLRALETQDDIHFTPDTTVGSSMFALSYFGVFDAHNEMVAGAMREVERRLWNQTEIGGLARFEHDGYMRLTNDTPGNPWFISTLWLAAHRIAIAKSVSDLNGARELLEWTVKRALPSGVLAEQLNPLTGEPLSVSPLTWSHSTFVETVARYLRKLREINSNK